MKNAHRKVFCLFLCVLLIACNQVTNIATPTLTAKSTSTPYPILNPTTTATFTPIPYQQSTLIPTIESANIPDLLINSLSIETLKGFNGHSLQRITGWSNGFNGGLWDKGSRSSEQGYLWMDSSHLLLFPATGETQQPNWETIYARPVVMNINTGKIWLPPIDRSLNDGRWFSIILPRWSPKLQVLVTGENLGQKEGTSTFTADGERLAHFEGQLIDISPSAERIFVAGDTWINLGDMKKVDFGWGTEFGYEVQRWFPIWSRDENQIYFCCYYYGNAETGLGYTIANEETIFDGGPFNNQHSLRHDNGVWLNDHVVMAQYGAWWYGGPGFSTIFDVTEKTYHNLGVVANLPDAFNNNSQSWKSISPNGEFMAISPGAQSATDPQMYMVDLKTLMSKLYHVSDVEWSANGKYAIMDSEVLTLSTNLSRPLPAKPNSEKLFYRLADAWHPTQGAYLSISADKQGHMYLYLLDVDVLTYRYLELPSNFDEITRGGKSIVWSPLGDKFALSANDGSIWQLDYPMMENLNQLTSPMENVKYISWSPDGNYLSYSSGVDIYVVDTRSNP